MVDAAIVGLSALGDLDLNQTLNLLRRNFLDSSVLPLDPLLPDRLTLSQGKVSEEVRLRCAETLYKIAARLGDLLPSHLNSFFTIFSTALQSDRNSLIRASSLALMAQLCRQSGWAVQTILEEVLASTQRVLETPSEPDEVQRGPA